jgi:chromosomal replication initiation ATPase DnaA
VIAPTIEPAIQSPREARPLWDQCARSASRPGIRATQRLCDLAALATAAAFAIPVGELIADSRRAPYIAFARQSAMYLAHVTFGLSYAEVGRAFGRDRTTAAYACRLIEERRDDPAVDAVLGSLESACSALRRRLTAPVQQ